MMLVVTSGARYIDIDAYACCIAYAELLRLTDRPVLAASTATWNESIPHMLRSLDVPSMTAYLPKPGDTYVIVDVSDPEQFDTFVDPQRVVEVLDHHPGFEDYWAHRIGRKSKIEPIGAAATLVYERWGIACMSRNMSVASATLLAAAIIDNTLQFKAHVTTERDRRAFQSLAKHASLNEDWIGRYFSDCQTAILADLPTALRNDTKFFMFRSLPAELCFAQMVVWDGMHIVEHEPALVAQVLGALRSLWLANVVSISDGKSYFLAEHPVARAWLHDLLGVTFRGSVATADRLWLRKEVLKLAQ